jgi:glycosyltransferase involved in cell wall biosynthesis
MLGWEFPPFISGGLGTACFGLTRAMSETGTQVLFVLPRAIRTDASSHVTLLAPGAAGSRYQLPPLPNVTFQAVEAELFPYAVPVEDEVETPETVGAAAKSGTATGRRVRTGRAGPGDVYAGDLFAEVERYAALCLAIAAGEAFDVVHAHDWMTFPAGIAIAGTTGRPLVAHVHSTEFDRSGEHVHERIYHIERQGVHAAQRVIAVSHLTKNLLVTRYGVQPEKIEVVYNAIDDNGAAPLPPPIRRDEKIVLFLGRITMQKGPEYFIAAAKRVLEVMDNVRFVMAGSGDMMRRIVELAAQMGIGHKVLFTGFLRGEDVARVYRMADLYVMPSVSEPFGIAPLEAMSHDVPVIISKQSGVSEVLTHVLKVDFWDVDEMANKIIAVLRHPPLQAALREHGHFEISKLTWRDSADKCLQVYHDAVARRAVTM